MNYENNVARGDTRGKVWRGRKRMERKQCNVHKWDSRMVDGNKKIVHHPPADRRTQSAVCCWDDVCIEWVRVVSWWCVLCVDECCDDACVVVMCTYWVNFRWDNVCWVNCVVLRCVVVWCVVVMCVMCCGDVCCVLRWYLWRWCVLE